MNPRSWMTLALLTVASCAQCPCAPQADCSTASDCGAGEECLDGKCEVLQEACTIDDECPADKVCLNGHCQPGTRTADAGPPDAGLECAFGESSCLTDTLLRTCEFGHLGQVDCSRNGYLCQDGGCAPRPCSPGGGDTRCVDLETEEACTGETAGQMHDCGAGKMCWRGRCAVATGAPCTADEECAGGFCWCKPGECLDPALTHGYCTQRPCNVDGGNACPAVDECIALSSSGLGRENICAPRASATCPESSDGLPVDYAGSFKRVLPTPDPGNPERWVFLAPVCFPPWPRGVGAPCLGATDCMGGGVGYAGRCESFGGSVASGACTHACDATHPCPPEGACAHFPADPTGAGSCLLRCGQQHPGLAACDRAGLACVQAETAGFAIVDGQTDPKGYCYRQP